MNKRLVQWCLMVIMCGAIAVTIVVAQSSACPDVPEPRLVIGEQGGVTPGSANNVRAEASTSASIIFRMEAGSRFDVLAGPVCAEDYNWWQVSMDGQSGWTVEGNSDGYFLAPITDDVAAAVPTTTSSDDCSLAPRLVVGQQGNLTSNTPSRLRDAAGVAGVQIGQIEPLDTFTILEGPVCVDGINWWRVAVGDLEGWTAEGVDDEYFLDLVPVVPTPTPAFVPLPQAYSVDWSSDGSVIAVGTVDGIFIFDVPNLQTPPRHLLADSLLAFNPVEPSHLAVRVTQSAEGDGADEVSLQILDLETGEIDQVVAHGFLILDRYLDLDFSADGTKLAVNSNGVLKVYDLQTGAQIYGVQPPDYGYRNLGFNGFASTAISPNSVWVAGQFPTGEWSAVFIGELELGEAGLMGIESVSIPEPITSIAFSPQSDRLVIGGDNGNLRMWTVPDFEYTSFIRGEPSTTSNRINAVAFSPVAPILITAESEPLAVVRVFDAYTLEQREATVLEDTVGGARDLVFSPDGTQLAVLVDNTVLILDATTFATLERLVLQWN